MKPRFQADADLDFDIVAGVLRREPSIDFQSAQEAILPGTPDATVLKNASLQGRILVSHDVTTMPPEFGRQLANGLDCSGVFMVPQPLPISAVIDEVVLIWSASEAHEWRNLLVWLPL